MDIAYLSSNWIFFINTLSIRRWFTKLNLYIIVNETSPWHGLSVCRWSVGLSVIMSLEGREVSLPCTYRSTCKHIYADIAFQAISILNSRFHAISFPLKLTRNKHYCGPDRQWRRGTTGGAPPPAFHAFAKNINKGATHYTLGIRPCIISSFL